MKKGNEKLMLFVLLGVVGLWQGSSLFRSIFIDTVELRENTIKQLQMEIGKKEIEEAKLKEATTKLAKWSARSLPPDTTKAMSMYQDWLRIQATDKAKLTAVEVGEVAARGGGNSADKTYTAITASIKAKGTLDKLLDFLHGFHQSGILHRVSQLTIESSKHEGNPELTIFIRVEALAMANSKERSTLLVDEAHPPKPEKPLKNRPEYDSIVTKNLFVSTFRPKPEQKKAAPPTGPVTYPDAAEYVKFTASFDGATIWFFDQTAGRITTLQAGSQFKIAGVEGKVITIKNSFVIVEVNGKQWRLDLGDHLKQMREV